ncbi:alpha/beta fold hydrolase [Gluconobacter sp. Dm-62]|uniref:alpha/beta hydrolase n=1 Tax=Gluconobacter sp. Dm-62 TaxID=2799804 RepID=UPI001B8B9574|nr:alpha/beta fold hydrolase [Gluconobacter sp. Dm-62]MBS1102721.1 alpha/beta fold hydrolase [Gluconobacter sp. Dm-62]
MIGPFPSVSNRFARLSCTVLCLLALQACTAPHMPDLHPTAQETALIPPTLTLDMSDGARIPLRLYPATTPEPRGIILALHGYGDSRDAWEFAAPTFAFAGFTLAAPDIRGFGQTADRGGWSSTARLVQDAREQVLWLHARYPNTPIHLMGESMGGAIALLLAATDTPHIASTVLLAPAALDIGQPWEGLLGGMDLLAPHWKLDGSAVPGHRVASDNMRALRRMYFDPLTLHSSIIHPLYGLTLLMRSAYEAAPKARTPLLIIFGGRDQFVLPPFTVRLLQKLPRGTRMDELPGGHHLLSRDRRGAAQDAVSWLTEPEHFLPSGGDIAAAAWQATAQTSTFP